MENNNLKREIDIDNASTDSALKWWHSMTFEEQFYKTIAWLKDQDRNTTERHPHRLTVDEIIEVHRVHFR